MADLASCVNGGFCAGGDFEVRIILCLFGGLGGEGKGRVEGRRC